MARALLAVALVWPAAALAADPDPRSLAVPADTAARATDLVGSLASREYAERVAATKELRALGRLALPTLREALAANTNPEVRLRVEMLLPAATAADIRAKVECFLADEGGKYRHDLPGAAAFFKTAGRTDSAKSLYRQVMRSANRRLITALGGREADLRRKYLARRAELHISPTGSVNTRVADRPTATDMAALLLAETHLPKNAKLASPGPTPYSVLRNSVLQNIVAESLETEDRSAPVSAILTKWMGTRDDPRTIYYAVTFMTRIDSPLGLPAARKLASGEVRGGSSFYRGRAIAYLGRFGTAAAEAGPLADLFDEKAAVTTVTFGVGAARKRREIQVRDLALAMSLRLAGQNPTDYGLTFRYAGVTKPTDAQKYMYSAYYFNGDTANAVENQREAAFKKYAAWRATQPKAKK